MAIILFKVVPTRTTIVTKTNTYANIIMYKIIIYLCKICISTHNIKAIRLNQEFRFENVCPFNANDNRKLFLLELAYYSIRK